MLVMKWSSTFILPLLLSLTCVQACATAEEFRLTDYLASGKNVGKLFESKVHHFRLSIPDSTQGDWSFVEFDRPTVPFYIVKPETTERTLPFISAMVDLMPWELVSDPNNLFQQTAHQHEMLEKQQIPDLKILEPGRSFTVNGLPAYERVFENPSQEWPTKFHAVYILYGDKFIQLGLNTKPDWFSKDDQDFMSIVTSFEPI